MYKQAIVAGAICAMLAVVLGAFGAHALKDKLSANMLQVFETGVRYQFYHSFALLAVGILYQVYGGKSLELSTMFFIIGIVLFSGSLYAISLMSINGGSIGKAGILTPIGGIFFILGWVQLLLGVIKAK